MKIGHNHLDGLIPSELGNIRDLILLDLGKKCHILLMHGFTMRYVFSSRVSVIDQGTMSSTESYPANLAMLVFLL